MDREIDFQAIAFVMACFVAENATYVGPIRAYATQHKDGMLTVRCKLVRYDNFSEQVRLSFN